MPTPEVTLAPRRPASCPDRRAAVQSLAHVSPRSRNTRWAARKRLAMSSPSHRSGVIHPEQQEPPVALFSPGFGAVVFCITFPQHEGAFWSAATVLVIPHATHL